MRSPVAVLAVLALAAASAASAAASPAGQTPYPAGTVIAAADADRVPQLLVLKGQSCSVDANSNGMYDSGEPVYLDVIEAICAGNVKAGDIRLTPVGSHAAGSRVKPGDADLGTRMETHIVGAAWNHRDRDGDGAYGRGDALYLDMNGDTVAQPGDLRLTRAGSRAAGTPVALTDPDHGAALATGTFTDASLYYWDLDHDAAFSARDGAFLDADRDGFVETGDIVVGDLIGMGHGDQVDPEHVLPIPLLTAVSARLCFVDRDGNRAYDDNEPVILDLVEANCSHGVDVTDLRLTPSQPSGGLPAFTFVQTADEDFNDKVYNFTTVELRHADVDATRTFTVGDALYADFANDGVVTLEDVRLTAFGSAPAGMWVRPSDPDGGAVLLDPVFNLDKVAYWDVDGNGKPSEGDGVYLDRDDDGRPEAGDVRLTAAPMERLTELLSGVAAPPPNPDDDDPPPPDDDATDEGPTTPPPDDGFDEAPAKKDSPAAAVGTALAAALAALIVRRRRA